MSAALQSLAQALATPAPWLHPHAARAEEVLRYAPGASVAHALNAAANATLGERHVRFVPHMDLPPGEPYESFIHRTACVPTRENLHDLFNGLMWLRFPRTKRRFNEWQAGEIARHGAAGPRGALRDALTVFDENGAVLEAPAPLVQALRARDWRGLFIEQRALWRAATLTVFGHALLEKLMNPRKAITAHVWVVSEGGGGDESLAAGLSAERLRTQTLLPLPVLGVPGWWPANAEPSFYDDAAVFRPDSMHRGG